MVRYYSGICTSNYMFLRATRDKLLECIFENFEIFKNHDGDLSKTCGYGLITSNQQTFCIETNIF